MARISALTQLGFLQNIPVSEISAEIPKIACPSRIITTEGGALGCVGATRKGLQTMKRSHLLVLKTGSCHVAASDADLCAKESLVLSPKRKRRCSLSSLD